MRHPGPWGYKRLSDFYLIEIVANQQPNQNICINGAHASCGCISESPLSCLPGTVGSVPLGRAHCAPLQSCTALLGARPPDRLARPTPKPTLARLPALRHLILLPVASYTMLLKRWVDKLREYMAGADRCSSSLRNASGVRVPGQ